MYHTYTNGFEFKTTRDITKREYIQICDELAFELNNLYNTSNAICVVPEDITGGGFRIIGNNYKCSRTKPNNFEYTNGLMYKTMRHKIEEFHSPHIKWPWIKDNSYEEWRNSDDVLFLSGARSTTFLKAFKGAPIWTIDELKVFKQILTNHGFVIKKMPKIKCLKCPAW